MTLRPLLLSLVLGTSLLAAAPARAQPGGGQGAPAADAKRERIRQRIAALRAWKLTDALGLDDATAGRLFPILASYDEKFLVALRNGGDLRRALRAEVEQPRPDAARVNRAVDALIANQDAIWKLQRERFAAVRVVLRPDQAAKALVLLPEIDREIGKAIRKAMRGRGDGATPGRRRDRVRNPAMKAPFQ